MQQVWYQDPFYNPDLDDNDVEQKMCQANTIIYFVASMQYVATVVAFSIGKPFRKPMHTNLLFTFNVILISVLNYYIMLTPDQFTIDFMNVRT